MSQEPEPMYAMHGGADAADEAGEWRCVTFQRLGADASPDDIIRVKLRAEDYDAAIQGLPIAGHKVGSRNWYEHEVTSLEPCGGQSWMVEVARLRLAGSVPRAGSRTDHARGSASTDGPTALTA